MKSSEKRSNYKKGGLSAPPSSMQVKHRGKGHGKAPKTRSPSIDLNGLKGGYWLYGHHGVMAALKNPRRMIEKIVMKENLQSRYAPLLREHHPHLTPIMADETTLSKICGSNAVHQGIAIYCQPLYEDFALSPYIDQCLGQDEKGLFLILDQVSDPRNIGAIIRSAAAFKAKAILTSAAHSPPEGAEMAKAACGGLEVIPYIRVSNLARDLKMMKEKGVWLCGLDGGAKLALYQAPKQDWLGLVLGAEGEGLRRLTKEECDFHCHIPIDADGPASLNVSNAAAIALYAFMH